MTRFDRSFTVLGLAFGSLLLSGCSPRVASAPTAETLATSTVGTVLRSDLEAAARTAQPATGNSTAGESPVAYRRRLVEELLIQRVLDREAADIDAEHPDLVQGRRDLLVQQLYQDRVGSRLRVADREILEYYETHLDRFVHEETVALRHIFRRVNSPSDRGAARDEMEKLRESLLTGANFSDAARDLSDSQTRHRGGRIGQIERGQLAPELETLVWSLEVGEISEIVDSPDGLQIFQVEETRPSRQEPYDEVRGWIHGLLQSQRREELRTELFEELLESSGAVYVPSRLDTSWEPGEEILFEVPGLPNLRLTLQDFAQVIEGRTLLDQRRTGLERQLEELALERLSLWEAQRSGLGDRPDVAEAMRRWEAATRIDLVYRQRAMALLDRREADLEEAFRTSRSRFLSPPRYRFRVLVRSYEGDRQKVAVHNQLRDLVEGVRAGVADFEGAVRATSQDLSRPRGGDLGWVHMDEMLEWLGLEARQPLGALEMGAITEPLSVRFWSERASQFQPSAFILVRLEEVQVPDPPTFESARKEVREHFFTEREDEVRVALASSILEEIEAVIYEENLHFGGDSP